MYIHYTHTIYIYLKLHVEDKIRTILKLKSQKIAKYFVVRILYKLFILYLSFKNLIHRYIFIIF